MFHLCKKANCASALGRDVNLARVHLERVRVLSQAQALALPYGADGVRSYLDALDGQLVDSSADERTALNQFTRPAARLKAKAANKAPLGAGAGPAASKAPLGAGTGLAEALAQANAAAAEDALDQGMTRGPGLGGALVPMLKLPPPKGGTPDVLLPKLPPPVLPKLGDVPPAGGAVPDAGDTPEAPAVTPKAAVPLQGSVMGFILESAQRLQLKRASSVSQPGNKRARAARDLVTLIAGVAGTSAPSAEDDDAISGLGNSLNGPLASAGELDFIGAPTTDNAEPLSLVSRRSPGRLFALGLSRVRDRLAALQGASASDADLLMTTATMNKRVMCFYHTVVCRPTHPSMRPHRQREMETLAELIDALLTGDLDRCGDIAMQRYKALEMSLADGSWEIVQDLEEVDRAEPCLATEKERFRGSRRRMA